MSGANQFGPSPVSFADLAPVALSALAPGDLESALSGGGLWFDLGAAVMRVRSDLPSLAVPLQSVYRNFPMRATPVWADLHVDLVRPRSLRRWWRSQVRFRSDGQIPFEPFPADTALPLLEWGANWLIGRRLNDLLLLHAGVVERDGLALVMPALPGSGKSTLTAALSLRGWRLLSDEFGAFDPRRRAFVSVLKPVALKNQSIAVIRSVDASAPLGPEFPKTRKGTVAHLAPDSEAVRRVHDVALPGAVVMPRWQAGSPTRLEPMPPEMVFSSLAFNAFNYTVLGRTGFDSVVDIAQRCPAWQLVYSDLEDAMDRLGALWPDVVAQALALGARTPDPVALRA